MARVDFDTLLGRTLVNVEGLEEDSDEVIFTTDDGKRFFMNHSQDCCEHVRILEIIGDVADLIGSEILTAEESESEGDDHSYDSSTWTFYKLSTRKGYVDIRWLGESNGYYSESVNFCGVE